MESLENSTGIWRFGVFDVDARNLELRRNGVPVRVREQSFRVLVYLLEHAGELVSREDLRRVLWPADTFVDFDHSLNTAMMKLRDALGDVADAPVYIETIPKRGYRFIAPVTQSGGARAGATVVGAGGDTAVSEPVRTQTQSIWSSLRTNRAKFGLGLLLLGGIVALIFSLEHSPRAAHVADRKLLRTIPITSAAGDAVSPVFSPDGREIAFVWDGSDRKGYDLYAQLIGADLPLRLTYHTHGLVGPPAWSADGSQIAFERCDGKQDGIFAVPALGGAERQLATAACYYSLPNPVAWIDNGNEMLMVDRCTSGGPFGVVDLSLVTGQKRCLTHIPGNDGDVGAGFALSPDGRDIAFGKTTVALCCDLYRIPVSGGQMTPITSDGHTGCSTLSEYGCSGIMWTPDGQSIVYVTGRGSLPALLRAPASGGTPERETIYPAIGSFTRDGTRFAWSQRGSSDPPAIWRADLSTPGGSIREKTKIIASQFPELDAQPSSDGKRIAWMSMRSGAEEIYISDANGHDQTRLTELNRYSGTPRWSPDGKWIAFDSYIPSQRVQIFVVDSEGRNVHSVISAGFDCVVPSWSHDGKTIYFSGNRDGISQVWKHDVATGADVQLTKEGGFNPFESPDGKTVYYTRFYEAGIWKVPVGGGAETLVVEGKPQPGFWGHYGVAATGLYFLDNDADPHPAIEFYDFGTQKISTVFTLDERPARLQPSLSVSADGKTIYFAQYDRQSVIKMMEFAP